MGYLYNVAEISERPHNAIYHVTFPRRDEQRETSYVEEQRSWLTEVKFVETVGLVKQFDGAEWGEVVVCETEMLERLVRLLCARLRCWNVWWGCCVRGWDAGTSGEVVVCEAEMLERLVKSHERVAAKLRQAVVWRIEPHQSHKTVAGDLLKTIEWHIQCRKDRHLVKGVRFNLHYLVVT